MKFSTLASIFGAALALTIGVKAAFTRALPEDDRALFGAQAIALLRSAGFETRRQFHPSAFIVQGRRGDCRMMIAEYDPDGTFADLLTIFAAPVGSLRYAWRGRLLAEPPRASALSERLVRNQLRRFGAAPSRHPIAAVAASPTCMPERLDWSSIAALPR